MERIDLYVRYYIEVTDERVDLDPPYVWQSEIYYNKEDAIKTARKIAQGFGRSNISPLLSSGEYLNPNWEKSAKGVKKFLHVDVMIMNYFDSDFGTEYEIGLEERIK